MGTGAGRQSLHSLTSNLSQAWAIAVCARESSHTVNAEPSELISYCDQADGKEGGSQKESRRMAQGPNTNWCSRSTQPSTSEGQACVNQAERKKKAEQIAVEDYGNSESYARKGSSGKDQEPISPSPGPQERAMLAWRVLGWQEVLRNWAAAHSSAHPNLQSSLLTWRPDRIPGSGFCQLCLHS